MAFNLQKQGNASPRFPINRVSANHSELWLYDLRSQGKHNKALHKHLLMGRLALKAILCCVRHVAARGHFIHRFWKDFGQLRSEIILREAEFTG